MSAPAQKLLMVCEANPSQAALGRVVSRDLKWQPNTYAYVYNKPVDQIDPFGLDGGATAAGVLGGFGGALGPIDVIGGIEVIVGAGTTVLAGVGAVGAGFGLGAGTYYAGGAAGAATASAAATQAAAGLTPTQLAHINQMANRLANADISISQARLEVEAMRQEVAALQAMFAATGTAVGFAKLTAAQRSMMGKIGQCASQKVKDEAFCSRLTKDNCQGKPQLEGVDLSGGVPGWVVDACYVRAFLRYTQCLARAGGGQVIDIPWRFPF